MCTAAVLYYQVDCMMVCDGNTGVPDRELGGRTYIKTFILIQFFFFFLEDILLYSFQTCSTAESSTSKVVADESDRSFSFDTTAVKGTHEIFFVVCSGAP